MLQEVREFIVDYINKNREEFHNVSRKIWEYPELGMEEFNSCKLLKGILNKEGFAIEENVAGMPTAFIATYGSGKPVIGFSAEYDALPGLSQQIVSHKEPVNEGFPGHGCGHNLLGVGGVMAGVALKEAMLKFGLKGTIKIFGTPAEELCIGKPVMGNAGAFAGVDVFLDWHPLMLSCADYMTCPAYFNIKYHFKGKTAHGNSPWHGRSALDAALLQAHAVEMLREHINPGNGAYAANTINYTFADTGPEFPSVVPDRTTAWYIGRFATSEDLVDVIERIDRCAEAAALATGTTVEKEYITASHEMIANKTVSEVVYRNLVALGNVEFTEKEKEFIDSMQKNEGQKPYFMEGIKPFQDSIMSVSDSSEYSWVAPYAILVMNIGPGPGWHNWMVTACAGGSHGMKAMDKAAQVLAVSAVDIIEDDNILVAAKKEHEERLGGKIYKSLLPEGTPIPLNINKKTMEKYR